MRVTEAERDLIAEKMAVAGIHNREAYERERGSFDNPGISPYNMGVIYSSGTGGAPRDICNQRQVYNRQRLA